VSQWRRRILSCLPLQTLCRANMRLSLSARLFVSQRHSIGRTGRQHPPFRAAYEPAKMRRILLIHRFQARKDFSMPDQHSTMLPFASFVALSTDCGCIGATLISILAHRDGLPQISKYSYTYLKAQRRNCQSFRALTHRALLFRLP
jgi:hypothetical protein